MKKRILASLLSLCLIVGLLPTAALAADGSGTEGESPAVCTCTARCAEGSVDETCPVCAEDYNSCAYEEAPAEPAEEPGDEPVEEPTEGPAGEPNPCALTEGCTLENGHEGACVLADEPQEPVGPTMEEQLAELIAALPDPADIDPLDEEQVAAVNGQISEIYAFAEENGLDVENDETINAVIAALYPVELLADEEGTQENPWDISAEGAENHVIAYLEKNSGDQSTYTLVISGSGAMADFPDAGKAPWYQFFPDKGAETAITKIEISKDVTIIGANAFVWCKAVKDVNFEAGSALKEIHLNGFHSLVQLTSIKLPASLVEIGGAAFYGCTALQTVAFQNPDQLTIIEGSAFGSCKALKKFNSDVDGKCDIPQNVVTIGSLAFQNCTSLTAVTIPAGVETLSATFYSCTKLTSVTFAPGSVVKHLSGSSSSDVGVFTATALTSIDLPDSVETIGRSSFQRSKLASITIPARVQSIGINAFAACPLTSVIFAEDSELKEIGQGAFASATVNEFIIPEGVESVGNSILQNGKVTSLIRVPSTLAAGFTLGWVSTSTNCVLDTSRTVYQIKPYGTNQYKIIYIPYADQKSNYPSQKTFAVTNGGFAVGSIEDGKLMDVERNGYIFAGWYDNEDFTGTAVTTPKTNKTYYAKWIELKHEGITLEYGSTSSSFPAIEGVALTGWTSADPDVVKIEGDKMIATGVGETTITANAALARSGEKLTVDVSVTPMPITFGTGEGENPHGTITYQYTGMAPDFAQFAKFYPAKVDGGTVSVVEGSEAVALTEGTDIVFVYNAGAGEQEYEYLPIDVTDNEGISVTIKLVNPNYRFVTESAPTQSDSIKETVIVQAEGKTEVPIMGVPAAGETMTYPYNGQPQPPVSNLTRMSAGSIKNFTIHFHPWGDTEFNEAHLENQTVDQLTPEAIRAIAPTEPGSYLMIVDGVSDSEYAYRSWIFTITKATVTIRPNDKSAYVGDAVPVLGENDYTVTGLVGDDTLSTKPTLAYEGTPDMSKAGTYAIKASDAAANEAHYTLVYEDGTLTVSRRSSGGGGGGSSSGGDYTVSVDTNKHGTVTVSPKRADKGDTVTITVKPDKGYELDSLTVTDKSGDTVKLKDKGNGKFTFTMPGSKVTVEASFKLIDAEPEVLVFADVPAGAWYADAVAWAVEQGVTTGTSATTFGPDVSCTRAQMVTFLWRAAGSPEPENTVTPFADVSATAYYYDAVLWAVGEGITNGTSATTFSPDATVNRGQTVTFLWRNAGSPVASGSSFADVAADAYYASAVAWAAHKGITSGTSATTFSPNNACTRAQIVTFLWRELA